MRWPMPIRQTSAERVVLSRVNQRLRALKADVRVTGYSSTDKRELRRFAQSYPADQSLSLALNNKAVNGGICIYRAMLEGDKRIDNSSSVTPTAHTAR